MLDFLWKKNPSVISLGRERMRQNVYTPLKTLSPKYEQKQVLNMSTMSEDTSF